MCKILLFGGTTEGRELSAFLVKNNISAIVCVATSYGCKLASSSDAVRVLTERLTAVEMEALMRTEQPELVIDATHPYAAAVTENILQAAQCTNVEYLRVLRASADKGAQAEQHLLSEDDGAMGSVVYLDSMETAIDWLNSRSGRILATTGSKELQAYTAIDDWQERVFARVLSTAESVQHCASIGFEGKHLIAMQGPFSKEMNEATLRQYECQYLVTKDSGKAGGFQEKIDAAFACGVIPVIIGRPVQEEGISLTECKRMLAKYFSCEGNQHITLLGIGMGSEDTLTIQGKRAVEKADLIIGARRIADAVALPGQEVFYEYRSREIVDYIQNHPEYSNIVVALSGDVGFYSGARKLVELFGEVSIQPEIICGISSVVYFMSKIGLSWDDAKIVSAHGKNCNLISLIRSCEKTFAILGTADGVAELSKKLTTYGMSDVILYVGENMSYPNEKIFEKPAHELQGRSAQRYLCIQSGSRTASGDTWNAG